MDKNRLLADLDALLGGGKKQKAPEVVTVDPNKKRENVNELYTSLQNAFRKVKNRAENTPVVPFMKNITPRNMATFQAPLEKQTKQLPNTVKSAFPITQTPEAVGEQVRQVGRVMTGKPTAGDVAGAVLPMAGSMKLKKVLSSADELASEQEKFAVIMNKIADHDALSIGGVEGASDFIANEGKIRNELIGFAQDIFGKKAVYKKRINDIKDMLFQYIRADDYVTKTGPAKPLLNKKPIVQKKPTAEDAFFLKKIVLDTK